MERLNRAMIMILCVFTTGCGTSHNSHNSECRLYKVEGKVQMVRFRAYAQDAAESLGLTGWVTNNDDGGVESKACGKPSKLDAYKEKLITGSPKSTVTSVEIHPAPYEDFESFERY